MTGFENASVCDADRRRVRGGGGGRTYGERSSIEDPNAKIRRTIRQQTTIIPTRSKISFSLPRIHPTAQHKDVRNNKSSSRSIPNRSTPQQFPRIHVPPTDETLPLSPCGFSRSIRWGGVHYCVEIARSRFPTESY